MAGAWSLELEAPSLHLSDGSVKNFRVPWEQLVGDGGAAWQVNPRCAAALVLPALRLQWGGTWAFGVGGPFLPFIQQSLISVFGLSVSP
jgi:hypothetical protein